MINKENISLLDWYRSHRSFEMFINLIIAIGMIYTMIRALGDHSTLHELLADTALIAGTAGIISTKRVKRIFLVILFIIVVVAFFTDGFS